MRAVEHLADRSRASARVRAGPGCWRLQAVLLVARRERQPPVLVSPVRIVLGTFEQRIADAEKGLGSMAVLGELAQRFERGDRGQHSGGLTDAEPGRLPVVLERVALRGFAVAGRR